MLMESPIWSSSKRLFKKVIFFHRLSPPEREDDDTHAEDSYGKH